MTPEDIKKIAEEYVDSFGSDSDYRNDPCYGGHIAEAEDVLEFLTERFYLVEKGKVEQEYEAAKWHKETAEGMNIQYGKGMACGQIMTLENLFGPDIRKEEEEWQQ